MKKIILVIVLLLFNIGGSFAYNGEDLKSFYINNLTGWNTIYTVPTGKDLIINKILVYDIDQLDNLTIRNNTGSILLYVDGYTKEYNNLNININDVLEVKQTSIIDNYTIFGYLVNEGDPIEAETGINKKVFDEETLIEIYKYEALIMFAILFFTFFYRLFGKKRKQKAFKFLNR